MNGFIYASASLLVQISVRINLVRYFKIVSAKLLAKHGNQVCDEDNEIWAKNIGIDVYQIFKFATVILLIVMKVDSGLALVLVVYLLWSNLFSYFFYHAWMSDHELRQDLAAQRRRFINFLLAIAFYILCYAYLYQFQFPHHIVWPDDINTIDAIYLSVANAFTLTYGGFAPCDQAARVLFMSELIHSFFFFSILIGNSVPSK